MSKATDSTTEGQHAHEQALAQFREPYTASAQVTGDPRRHSDSDAIRRVFGVPGWEPDRYRFEDVLPNVLEHTLDATRDQDAGGTDLLAYGKPGSGKSTLAAHFATRLLEINDEAVVWRGSPSRSEWLPLAPWAELALPAGVDLDIRLMPRDPRLSAIDLGVDDLERIVRDVRFYSDPVRLNQEILEVNPALGGRVTVVYPDPRMRGLQELYERSPYKQDDLEFSPADPPKHWWFGWLLARIEEGPHTWSTLIFDEIGDLLPQNARKDESCTYQKIVLTRDLWVDARKKLLSVFGFGHTPEDTHSMLRRKCRWRVSMPGRSNPTSRGEITGFGSVPMNNDLSSELRLGEALMYTERHFQRFGWPEYSADVDYKLKISFKQ